MVISIPIIATAIIKGGEVAFQAVTGVGAIQSAASANRQCDEQGQRHPELGLHRPAATRAEPTSAFMSTTSDAHGTTIQGSGPDAGVFRYQATLSRLASTFTFSERQATALGESAREAETLATTERDAMQRSQAAALTNALGIQDSYDRSQQRSGASTTSDGGSTSTQFQKLNSVAREVNRRLGLGDESTVGKSVAASASIGAKIPLTEIGARRQGRGPCRRPAKTSERLRLRPQGRREAQLSEATALVKDFRSSDAYQWARGNRTTATAGYDSSYREASDRQSSSDSAYGRAKELARTAQFMREWSSGTQTDFTNYAARDGFRTRIAARGRSDQAAARRHRDRLLVRARRSERHLGNHSGYVPSGVDSSAMIRCNLSTLMGRDKLRISDVVRETGLNRSTITALYKETATRVDLPAIDLLCRLFRCQVGELFEHLPEAAEERP
jgi:DNA-binding Xre family transcriptional regulator